MDGRGPYHLGLVGYPLGHSLSPHIHRAALRSLGLEGEYVLYTVPNDANREAGLKKLLEKLREGVVHGLNVTIPYKIEAVDLIDELSPPAEAIGAVNTLFCQNGRLIGDNTDAAGFLKDLRKLFPQLEGEKTKKLALVLGSGGAARAVVYALVQSGWRVSAASRSLEKGQQMTERLTKDGSLPGIQNIVLEANALNAFSQQQEISLIVNATSVGMLPKTDSSPWPEAARLPEKAVVYDLVYSPSETCFVRAARQAGLQAESGLGMLVEQAACAFEIWTGRKPDREILMDALRKEVVLP